jgi:transposase
MTDTRRRYPSDLTESQWLRLKDILPPEPAVGRHRTIELRDIANAINYRWETGCVWRMLPHDFPAWGTVYAYFRTWQRSGVIRQFRDILLEPRPKPVPRSKSVSPDQAATSPNLPSATEKFHRFHPADAPGFSSPHDRSDAMPRPNPASERAEM